MASRGNRAYRTSTYAIENPTAAIAVLWIPNEAVSVRRDELLTARQVIVLQWIGDGCPDGVWTDFTYKTTTYALAARNLVKVDRRHGSWSAALTETGQFYLDHGHYPTERTPAGSHPATESIAEVEAVAAEILAELATEPRTVTVLAPAPRERALYRRAIHHIITTHQIPEGFQLRHAGRDHGDLTIRLIPESDAPQRRPTPEVAVPAEGSAVSSEVRDLAASRRMAVSDNAMERALRIVQAIYTECLARGWTLRADRSDQRAFEVTTPECTFELTLTEELVNREMPDKEVLSTAKYSWQRVPLQMRKVGSGRLSLRLGRYYRYRTWADRARWTLEDKLGAAFAEMQSRVDDAAAERLRTEDDLLRRQQAWDAAALQARAAYVVDLNRRRLREQAARHGEALALRTYAQALAALAASQPDSTDPAPLSDWARAAIEEAQRLDPLNDRDSLQRLEPENPQPDDYAPFMPKGMNAHRRPTQ